MLFLRNLYNRTKVSNNFFFNNVDYNVKIIVINDLKSNFQKKKNLANFVVLIILS